MISLQTLGYHIKLSPPKGAPPVVFVLSELSAKVLLFQSTNEDSGDIVECIQLPDYPIWLPKAENGHMINPEFLVLVLLLSGCNRVSRTPKKVRYPGCSTRKSAVVNRVRTVQEEGLTATIGGTGGSDCGQGRGDIEQGRGDIGQGRGDVEQLRGDIGQGCADCKTVNGIGGGTGVKRVVVRSCRL